MTQQPHFVLSIALLGTAFAGGAEPNDRLTSPTDAGTVVPRLQWVDYDADGLSDAFAIYPAGEGRLFRNMGDGTFSDVTQAVGLPIDTNSPFAAWADFDGDSLVDVYLTGARPDRKLFRNLGLAGFSDVTSAAGLAQVPEEHDAAWIDFDLDGTPDLWIRCADGDRVYRNDGERAFAAVTFDPAAGVAQAPSAVVEASALGVHMPAAADEPASREPGRPRDPIDAEHPMLGTGSTARRSTTPLAPSPAAVGASALTAAVPSALCTRSVLDQATGTCSIQASTTPTLGMLFPMSVALNVAASGRVGIGTTNPVGALHVAAASGTQAISVSPPWSGSYGGLGVTTAASNRVWLTASGGEDVSINSNGKVGIGAPATDYSLLIQSRSDAPQRRLLNIQDLNSSMSGGTELVVTGESFGINLTNTWGPLSLGASNAGLVNQRSMTIDPSGNVAIGTSPSTSRLLVNGEIRSVSGGFRFPDGSVQTTAAGGAGSCMTVQGTGAIGTAPPPTATGNLWLDDFWSNVSTVDVYLGIQHPLIGNGDWVRIGSYP